MTPYVSSPGARHRTVLVLGAAGRFGAAAVQAFSAAGWRVLAQRRRVPEQPLPPGTEFIDTPLSDTAALAARAAGAEVVVYAVNPPYTRWDTDLMPLFGQGMAVARALQARFMLPGNIYNFGSAMPPRLDVDTPQRPDTAKGRQRVAMEMALQAAAADGLDSVVLRAGDFFGGGTGSWIDLVIVKDIARGRLVYPGPRDVPHAWAYLPDLARAAVALAQSPRRRGLQVVHFAGHTLTGHELVAAIGAAAGTLGLRPAGGFQVGGLPWPLLRVAGLVWPMGRELSRMSYLWRVPHGLEGRSLREALSGPLPATPIEAAVRQALQDLGLAGAAARVSAA